MSLENALQSLELHSNFETKPSFELPDDSGMEVRSYKLPDDSGIVSTTDPSANLRTNLFCQLHLIPTVTILRYRSRMAL